MDQPRPIEPDAHPRWRNRKQTDGTIALPADLLREQSIRIQLIYVLGSVLWTINLVMDQFWAPQGDRGPYRPLIEMLGIALAAAVACFARFSRTSDDMKVDVGVAFMVPHARPRLAHIWSARDLGDEIASLIRSAPSHEVSRRLSLPSNALVALQARAARGDAEADAAYIVALKDSDVELQMWALWKAKDRIKVPSPALADALLASWPTVKEVGPVLGAWNAAGLVANAVVTWRLQRTAPFFAKILTTSGSGDERAWAAMALGGSGARAYLPVLRRVAAEDAHAHARALAYNGIMHLLGPNSLGDLRLGAKDSDEQVRARVVVDSYNLLEFGHPEPRWPPPSNGLIDEVRTFLTEMQRDPARLVSDNAKSMLAMIARRRP
jgi:hypothetical protein